MNAYLIIAEDNTNLAPMHTLFSSKAKARNFFAKELQDYWPADQWSDDPADSWDANGRTPQECIENMTYSDADNNWLYCIELEVNSPNWQ